MGMQNSKGELTAAADKLKETAGDVDSTKQDYQNSVNTMADMRQAIQSLVLPLLQEAVAGYEAGANKLRGVCAVYDDKVMTHLEASGVEGTGPLGEEFAAKVKGIGEKIVPAQQIVMRNLYQDDVFVKAYDDAGNFDAALKDVRKSIEGAFLADEAILPAMIGLLTTAQIATEMYADHLDH